MSTIYVATTGNDSNNGLSRGSAYRTIDKASHAATTGDTIYITVGTYQETEALILPAPHAATAAIVPQVNLPAIRLDRQAQSLTSQDTQRSEGVSPQSLFPVIPSCVHRRFTGEEQEGTC